MIEEGNSAVEESEGPLNEWVRIKAAPAARVGSADLLLLLRPERKGTRVGNYLRAFPKAYQDRQWSKENWMVVSYVISCNNKSVNYHAGELIK